MVAGISRKGCRWDTRDLRGFRLHEEPQAAETLLGLNPKQELQRGIHFAAVDGPSTPKVVHQSAPRSSQRAFISPIHIYTEFEGRGIVGVHSVRSKSCRTARGSGLRKISSRRCTEEPKCIARSCCVRKASYFPRSRGTTLLQGEPTVFVIWLAGRQCSAAKKTAVKNI